MKWYVLWNRCQRKPNYYKDYGSKGSAENEKNGNYALHVL